MSISSPVFVNTFNLLILKDSLSRNSFALDIPCLSDNFARDKSKIIFSDCAEASLRLFCIVCLPPPSGDFNSQRTPVLIIYKSGVLLCLLRIKKYYSEKYLLFSLQSCIHDNVVRAPF